MTEEPNQQPEQSGDQSAPRLYDLGAALVESSPGQHILPDHHRPGGGPQPGPQ